MKYVAFVGTPTGLTGSFNVKSEVQFKRTMKLLNMRTGELNYSYGHLFNKETGTLILSIFNCTKKLKRKR